MHTHTQTHTQTHTHTHTHTHRHTDTQVEKQLLNVKSAYKRGCTGRGKFHFWTFLTH